MKILLLLAASLVAVVLLGCEPAEAQYYIVQGGSAGGAPSYGSNGGAGGYRQMAYGSNGGVPSYAGVAYGSAGGGGGYAQYYAPQQYSAPAYYRGGGVGFNVGFGAGVGYGGGRQMVCDASGCYYR